MQQYVITGNEAGQRLDKFLNKYMPEAGKGFLYKMLRKKNITCNRKRAEGSEILAVGDTIETFFSDETYVKMRGIHGSTEAEPDVPVSNYLFAYKQLRNISVLYEDTDFLFLSKPAGVLTQRADKDSVSVNEWLIGYLLQNHQITREQLRTFRPSVCNRLDRNTSGLVLCGKTLAGSQVLSHLLAARTLHKYYRCIVLGTITDSMQIDGYLGKDHRRNQVEILREAKNGYAEIHTAYEPIRHNGTFTELEVQLITGKTHQIRAHLASVGHPVLGDPKYGDLHANIRYHCGQGQLLHAYRIQFPTATQEPMLKEHPDIAGREFVCPVPARFRNYIS